MPNQTQTNSNQEAAQDSGPPAMADLFDEAYASAAKSPTMARIFREVYGADVLPDEGEMTIPVPGFPPQVDDYRPLLRQAGFEMEVYEETPDWERRQRGVYADILASTQALIQERGQQAAGFMIEEARHATGLVDGIDYLAHSRRVLAVARRTR